MFGKPGGPVTLKANEALEEALCFGWIDGQMQSIDELSYIKYFKQRSIKSKWSEKNKKLVEKLECNGQMTDFGRQRKRMLGHTQDGGLDTGAAAVFSKASGATQRGIS